MVTKNTKRSSALRTPIIILLIIGVIIAGLGVAYLADKHSPTTRQAPPATKQLTSDQLKAESASNATAKKQYVEAGPKSGGTSAPTAASPPVIDLSSRVEPNNTVTIFTKLTGINDGTCNLAITNGSQSYKDSAAVIYQPEYSSCSGFSVPIDRLGKGSWSVTLNVVSNGQSQSESVTVDVR